MKKVIVIGCPGSGKSTFSRALSEKTGLPIIHLDMLFWNPDKTTVDRSVFLKRLSDAMNADSWIIDGNYGSTMEMRMNACDTVFFLDYSFDTCLDGVMSRRGKPRPDMPWIESPDEVDEEFLQTIRDFKLKSKPHIISLLKNNNQKDIIIFKNRTEQDGYLSQLPVKSSLLSAL